MEYTITTPEELKKKKDEIIKKHGIYVPNSTLFLYSMPQSIKSQ